VDYGIAQPISLSAESTLHILMTNDASSCIDTREFYKPFLEILCTGGQEVITSAGLMKLTILLYNRFPALVKPMIIHAVQRLSVEVLLICLLILWLPLSLHNAQAEQRISTVDSYIEALKDHNPVTRMNAAEGLGRFGSEAEAAITALSEALKDNDPRVRGSAAWALERIGSEARAAVPHLIEALRDQNQRVRRAAAGALGRMGPEAKVAIPALIEALKDHDPAVRRNAAWALGDIGPLRGRGFKLQGAFQ
jgi:HEAT repeat protein